MKEQSLKFILSLTLLLLPLAGSADVNIDGIYYKLNSNDKTAQVVFHRGYTYSGDLVIPSLVTRNGAEYRVTSISRVAFSGSTELTSVTIPNSVTSIGLEAFNGCTSLTSVTISSSVTSIGSEVFKGCTSLMSIIVDEGNTVFDSRENCNAIIGTASNKLLFGCNGTTIPNSVTSIGKLAFSYSGITRIVIPDGVTSIDNRAIENCSALTYIYIGKGLVNFGYELLYGCDNLKTVEINNNTLVSKDYGIQESVSGLLIGGCEELILGEDVTSIGNNAFYSCMMTSVKMSDNVTSIGDNAFRECPQLTSIKLSENLTTIGKWAFATCQILPSVTIPKSVKCIGQLAFQWCYKLTKVEINSDEVVSRDNEQQYYTVMSCFGKQVKEYVLGEDVKKIAYIAFSESDELTSVTISSNLTCVDDSAFYKCSSLTDMYCYAEQVPTTGKDVFDSSNYKNATLHVPAASVEAYKSAEQWKEFGNIVALTDEDPKPTTEIIVPAIQQPTIVERYTIDGKRIATLQHGLNIIKMSDGTTKKVVVK